MEEGEGGGQPGLPAGEEEVRGPDRVLAEAGKIFINYTAKLGHVGSELVMSTIPKRKYKRSDIEANYRNETETFRCVLKKEVERFYIVQKLGNKIITFLCVPEPFKSKSGRFYVV